MRLHNVWSLFFLPLLLAACVTSEPESTADQDKLLSSSQSGSEGSENSEGSLDSEDYSEMTGEVDPLTDFPEDGEDDFVVIEKKVKEMSKPTQADDTVDIDQVEEELSKLQGDSDIGDDEEEDLKKKQDKN